MKKLISLLLFIFPTYSSQLILVKSSTSLVDGLVEAITCHRDKATLDCQLEGLPVDLQRRLISKYLEQQGFSFVKSLDGSGLGVYLYKPLEKENYFRPSNSNDLRQRTRPLRHPNNRFLGKGIDGGFDYEYTELIGSFEKHLAGGAYPFQSYKDHTEDRIGSYHTEPGGLIGAPAGPTRKGYFARNLSGMLNILRKEERTHILTEVASRQLWMQGKPTDITALTMDGERDLFYTGTKSGRVFRHYGVSIEYSTLIPKWVSTFFNWKDEQWNEEALPTVLENPITYLEITGDGAGLWLLSGNRVYLYTFETENLSCVASDLPEFPSDAEDEPPETLAIVRIAPVKNHLVLGGTKGKVVLLNVATQQCFLLDDFEQNSPIVGIWWNEKEEFFVATYLGEYKKGTLKVAYVDDFIVEQKAQ